MNEQEHIDRIVEAIHNPPTDILAALEAEDQRLEDEEKYKEYF